MPQIDDDLRRQLAVDWTTFNKEEAILHEIKKKATRGFLPVVSKLASKHSVPQPCFWIDPVGMSR